MSGSTYFPSTDAGLLAWSANFSSLISASPLVYGLSAPLAAAYAALHTAYADALTESTNPITRTKGKVEAKNLCRTNLKNQARLLVSIIQGQAGVSNEQKIDLGITVRREPAPIPAPSEAPDIDIVSVSGSTVRIKVHDSEVTRRGLPPGVAGVTYFSFVGEEAPTSESGWDFQGNSTRTIVDIDFPGAAPGAKVWFTAFWRNPRDESGPAATPIGTNIAGGGAMAA